MTKQNTDMNILWVILSHFGKGAGIKAHEHDYHHIFYIHSGSAVFVVNDRRYEVGAGCAVYACRGVTHELKPIENEMTVMSEIKFAIANTATEATLMRLPALVPPDDLTKALIDKLMDESVRLSASTQSAMKAYLFALLYSWSSDVRHSSDEESCIIETSGFSAPSKAIVRYLEDNYKRNISLQDVADAVGYNKNYICSVFKHDSGITVMDCLYFIRVRKAAEFISYSDMQLAQVAENTGFANISHFNRTFKQITHISPGQYRRYYDADLRLKEEAGGAAVAPPPKYNEAFVVSVLAGKKVGAETLLKYCSPPEDAENALL